MKINIYGKSYTNTTDFSFLTDNDNIIYITFDNDKANYKLLEGKYSNLGSCKNWFYCFDFKNNKILTWNKNTWESKKSLNNDNIIHEKITDLYSSENTLYIAGENNSLRSIKMIDDENNISKLKELKYNIQTIYSTKDAISILLKDNSLSTRGNPNFGGNSSYVSEFLSTGIKNIYSNDYAFASIKNDNSVVTWGNPKYGGDSSLVKEELKDDVQTIFSNDYNFIALKYDGTIIQWGNIENIEDAYAYLINVNFTDKVKTVYSNKYAFAALQVDGKIKTWGASRYGGDSDLFIHPDDSNFKTIYSTEKSFAALKFNGDVIIWGEIDYIPENTLKNIVEMYSTKNEYIAIDKDNKIIRWDYKEDVDTVKGVEFLQVQPEKDYEKYFDGSFELFHIFTNENYFLANFKKEKINDIVVWGNKITPQLLQINDFNVDEINWSTITKGKKYFKGHYLYHEYYNSNYERDNSEILTSDILMYTFFGCFILSFIILYIYKKFK